MQNEQPKIEELAERDVAFVSYTGNYMGNSQLFAELFGKLCGWAGPKGLIRPEAVFLSSYQDDPRVTPPEELQLDVCMSIPGATEVEGDIQKKTLPGGRYVVMQAELTGPEEYGPAWAAVVDWMEENKQTVDMARPSYEIYLNNPEEHPENHHIINICMSIQGE